MEQKPKEAVGEQPAELEGVIQRILDIDAKARSVTAEAQNLRLEAEQNIAGQKAAMREKYRKEAEHRIELVRAEEEKLAEESLAHAQEEQARQLDMLNQAYEKNAAGWVEEIYRRAIQV